MPLIFMILLHLLHLEYLNTRFKQKMDNTNFTNYLTTEELAEVQKAFTIFDQDNSGSISIREFDQILKSLGQNLREEELEMVIQRIDRDGNGFIDFDEFLFLVAPKIIGNRSERNFVEAFRIMDTSRSGVLTAVELKKANLVTGAGLTEEEIIEIVNYVEDRFQGKFDLESVLTMLQRNPDNNEES